MCNQRHAFLRDQMTKCPVGRPTNRFAHNPNLFFAFPRPTFFLSLSLPSLCLSGEQEEVGKGRKRRFIFSSFSFFVVSPRFFPHKKSEKFIKLFFLSFQTQPLLAFRAYFLVGYAFAQKKSWRNLDVQFSFLRRGSISHKQQRKQQKRPPTHSQIKMRPSFFLSFFPNFFFSPPPQKSYCPKSGALVGKRMRQSSNISRSRECPNIKFVQRSSKLYSPDGILPLPYFLVIVCSNLDLKNRISAFQNRSAGSKYYVLCTMPRRSTPEKCLVGAKETNPMNGSIHCLPSPWIIGKKRGTVIAVFFPPPI